MTVTLYNGNGGGTYGSAMVIGSDFTAGETGVGYAIYSIILPSNGLQNGAPDGICLDIGGSIAHFISYEGALTATDGPAAGLTSTDVGVSEGGGTTIGSSIGLAGAGGGPDAFMWGLMIDLATPGVSNDGQTIAP